MVILAFVTSLINLNPDAMCVKVEQKDTLYYVVFMDLFERDFTVGDILQNNTAMVNERRDVAKQIRRRLSRRFVLIPGDSCYSRKTLADARKQNDTLGIQKYCDECRMSHKLLIVDASWFYLSESSFAERQRKERSADLVRSNTYITGTWWDIRILVYDPKRGRTIYFQKYNETQWDNVKPMKKLPGVGHRRFFNWPLRDMRRALRRQKSKSHFS